MLRDLSRALAVPWVAAMYLQAWAFMPLAQLPDLVVEFKRDVYQQVCVLVLFL
jgi:hypothetical protein